MNHFGSRLLDLALSVLVAVLLLVWAWRLIRPLLPIIVAGVATVGIASLVLRFRRYW